MKGLIIRSPWIDLILAGEKTWEMRTRPVSTRGRIALIRAKSGLIYGTAELIECLPALTPERMRETHSFHAIPEVQIEDAIENRWTTPWVLRDITLLASPIPYVHPKGAVTWVELPDELLGTRQPGPKIIKPKVSEAAPCIPPQSPAASTETPQRRSPVDWADILLTEGNIRHGHFYLRTAERLLPGDCIGGSNNAQAAKANIRVQFQPGMLAESDVAGDKMILRMRGPVRDFFALADAKAGDHVRFSRVGDHDFVVTLRPAT